VTCFGAELFAIGHGDNIVVRGQANAAEISDQIGRPAVDVVFLHSSPHSPHPDLAFLGG
jgi:hypothetical protein